MISDEIVIQKEADKRIVYATEERACKVINSESVYDNEQEDLDDFIERLRWMNRWRRKQICSHE